jgi:hypothetical protein
MKLAHPKTPDCSITIGDVVRSFDFPGFADVYQDGVVTAFVEIDGCRHYSITTLEKNRKIYPPCNGTETTFGHKLTCGVMKLTSEQVETLAVEAYVAKYEHSYL